MHGFPAAGSGRWKRERAIGFKFRTAGPSCRRSVVTHTFGVQILPCCQSYSHIVLGTSLTPVHGFPVDYAPSVLVLRTFRPSHIATHCPRPLGAGEEAEGRAGWGLQMSRIGRVSPTPRRDIPSKSVLRVCKTTLRRSGLGLRDVYTPKVRLETSEAFERSRSIPDPHDPNNRAKQTAALKNRHRKKRLEVVREDVL